MTETEHTKIKLTFHNGSRGQTDGQTDGPTEQTRSRIILQDPHRC